MDARPASNRPADAKGWILRLSRGEQVLGASSAVLFISLFVDAWLHRSQICVAGVGTSECGGGFYASGFNGWGWLTFFALAVVGTLFVVRTFLADSVGLPEMPLPDWQMYVALGAVEAVSIVLFWIEFRDPEQSTGVGWAWVVALVAAVATMIGGVLKRSDPEAVVALYGEAVPVASGSHRPPPRPHAPAAGERGYAAPPPPSAPTRPPS